MPTSMSYQGMRREANVGLLSRPAPKSERAVRSPGKELDPGTRATMEPRFGHDFSRVRVHSDSEAAQSAKSLNAEAYTVGQDIVFDRGRYDPGSKQGQKLLAHELAHTVQQSKPGVTKSGDGEKEADRAASAVASGGRADVRSGQPLGVQRQPKPDPAPKPDEAPPAAAAAQTPAAAPDAAPAASQPSWTIDGFETGKSKISKPNGEHLDDSAAKLKTLLKEKPGSKVRIVGHTDAIGTDERNQALGQERANAVLADLGKKGVPLESMSAESKGESQLLIDTKKAEPRNRRVQIIFEPAAEKPASTPAQAPATAKPEFDQDVPKAPPSLFPKPPPIIYGPGFIPVPDPKDTLPGPRKEQINLPPDFWKPLPPAPQQKGASLDDWINGAAHKLTSWLPKSVQSKAQDLVKDAIEKGITSGLDSALQGAGVGDTERKAIGKAAEAAIKQKIGGTPSDPSQGGK